MLCKYQKSKTLIIISIFDDFAEEGTKYKKILMEKHMSFFCCPELNPEISSEMCFHSSPLVGAKESRTDGDDQLAS